MTMVKRCPECGGPVRPSARDGRIYYHRGRPIELPADVAIPTCRDCGAEYLDKDLCQLVTDRLEALASST